MREDENIITSEGAESTIIEDSTVAKANDNESKEESFKGVWCNVKQ